MGKRQTEPPAGESRLIALLAVLSCLPLWLQLHSGSDSPPGVILIIEVAVGLVAVLPLSMPGSVEFRTVALTSGWLLLGSQIAFSALFLLLPLIIFVAALPAGVLLLIAARRDAPLARLVIAAGITAVPYIWLLGWVS